MSAIGVAIRADVATITLDRPHKLNTITPEMGEELAAACHAVDRDDAVRVVVLRGAGDRAFSAGSDVAALERYGDTWQLRNRTDYVRAVLGIRKPVIAAVHGYAIGGGLELAMAADIRVAATDARFGAGEIKLGWLGGAGATQILPRLVPPGHALKLLLTGEAFSAEHALSIGLVQELVAPELLGDRVAALAERIAANAPIAAQLIKHLVRVAHSSSLEVGMAYENDAFAYLFTTADAGEGRSAFLEKRPPRFTGT